MFNLLEKIIYHILGSFFWKSMILFITFVSLIGAIMMIPMELVLAKMLPGKNNDTFNIYIDLPNGSSISQTRHVGECIVSQLKNEKEIINFELFLGMGSPLDFAGLIKGSHFKQQENLAEIVINLSPKHHRKEPSYLMVQRIRPEILKTCGEIFTKSSIKFIEPPAGPPTMGAVVAEIYGESDIGIREVAEQVKNIFISTKGLVDIDIMQDEIYSKIEIEIDNIKVIRSGLDIKNINDLIYLSLEGMSVAVKNSKIYDDQVAIYLSLDPKGKVFKSDEVRDVELKLSSLKMMNSNGLMIPLSELVKIKKISSNPMIVTKDLHKMTNVVAETDMISQVYPLLEARTKIINNLADQFEIEQIGLFDLKLKSKNNSLEYLLKWDGEMRVTIDTFIDLGGAFITAMILIFLLMVIYYKSYILSTVVLIGSLLSIIGVIFGHWIMDQFTEETFFLTATSLIGFIALIGISSRNTLLLIDFTKSLLNEMDQRRAVAYATATRAKPIFLTASAIILASTLLASDAVFGGLGVSLIFGTISAVVASLIVIPIFINSKKLN
jgi:multidrug efflux pump subunit AcrB